MGQPGLKVAAPAALLGGLVLIVAVALPWFTVVAEAGSFSASASASGLETRLWDGAALIGVGAASAGIGLALTLMASSSVETRAMRLPLAVLLVTLGIFACVTITLRLLDPPLGLSDEVLINVDVTREVWGFVALGAATVISIASLWIAALSRAEPTVEAPPPPPPPPPPS